jgi:hypothetical protein
MQQILMPLILFLPLVSLAIYLIPIYLLRRKTYARTQDYFVASGYTPPGVIRNSSIAYGLKMATFGPFFAWGAGGDFWPAIINSAFFAVGVCLIYILRRPILEFLETALKQDRSITVHEFIARQHGNDSRVRLLASLLTIFAALCLIIAEALVVATFLKPILSDNALSTSICICGLVVLMALYAMLSGNSGVMRSAQSQLGMCYLGLFGAAALLLYLLISALRPMGPHSTFAIMFVAACCAVMPLYRRSRYVDTGPIRGADRNSDHDLGGEPSGARLFRRFEKIFNVCISVFAAWVIVLAGMQLSSDGVLAAAREGWAALGSGTHVSAMGLVALLLLPVFYPIVDMTNWQRLAAYAKDFDELENEQRSATFRSILRIYGLETPLMTVFMCTFGTIAVVAMGVAGGMDALQEFVRALDREQNAFAAASLTLLLVSVLAIALSTMSSLFSASLCTVRYDVLPALWPKPGLITASGAKATLPRLVGAGALCLITIVGGFLLANAYLHVNYTSSEFLALLFALSCAQLSFVPLILGPIIARTSRGFATVSSGWALLILGVGAAMGVAAVAIYLETGSEPWLWTAVPASLASGLVLFTVARLWTARTKGAA